MWATVASVAAWVVPVLSLAALPLQYLNTHVHELFHALAGLATGGQVGRIAVHANGSGATEVFGGNMLAVASAGYVGSVLLGSVILASARTERGARIALGWLGAAVAFSMLVWVRADAVGLVSGAAWAVLLLWGWRKLSGDALLFAAAFLGVQQSLQAIQSLLVLLNLSAYPQIQSDAAILGQASGTPPLLWALLWSGLGVTLTALGARRAWSGR